MCTPSDVFVHELGSSTSLLLPYSHRLQLLAQNPPASRVQLTETGKSQSLFEDAASVPSQRPRTMETSNLEGICAVLRTTVIVGLLVSPPRGGGASNRCFLSSGVSGATHASS